VTVIDVARATTQCTKEGYFSLFVVNMEVRVVILGVQEAKASFIFIFKFMDLI